MFTVQYLNSLNPKKTPYREYEKESRAGFGVQVSPKGTKTFFYAYKIEGKQRFMKLGVFGNGKGEISLKKAGDEWEKWKNIRKERRDPQIVRDNKNRQDIEQKIEAERAELEFAKQGTYEQLLDGYIKYLSKEKSEKSVKDVRQAFNANAYKVIKKATKAKDITVDDINETLALIEKRGANVMSNRMRAYLSSAFTCGIRSDSDRTKTSSTMFGLNKNPVRDVLKSEKKEAVGMRELSDTEIKILWHNLRDTNISSKIVATIKLLVATGQRVNEVLRLNINDIDNTEMLWELAKTKNGKPHVVVLPELALEIIHELIPNKRGYLLNSDINGEPMNSMSVSQACARFCKQTGFEKYTPRDLRRTWKTLAGKAGISKFDRDRYQNHAMNDVSSKHYDRYDYLAEKRNVAVIWNDYLKNIIHDKSNVLVPIKKRG